MKITIEDKSTRQGVLLKFFIPATLLSIFFLFSVPLTWYSDSEKNKLKWIGASCGCIFQFSATMFGFGIYFLITDELPKGVLMTIFSAIFISLNLLYIIKKYNKLRRETICCI